jgi:hypothetical protein
MNRPLTASSRWQNKPRQGVLLVLGAFMMSMLMMFAAFAIDIGFIVLTQAQLQNAADAAALAATLELKTSDISLTREEIRENAIDQAKAVALLNYAAGRPVVLESADVTLGNRSFDNNTQKWVTVKETDSDFGERQYNSVHVNIAFDQTTGPRAKLDLFFARVLGHKTAIVEGESRSHLTPRDLVFCIDVSGSMFGSAGGDTPGRGSGDAVTWCRRLFKGIYDGTAPDKAFRLSDWKGKYEDLWKTAMTNDSWGTNTQRNKFLEQQFPGYTSSWTWDTTKPWEHWKWRAFCDFAFCHNGGTGWASEGIDYVYKGIGGQPKNLNVVRCSRMAYRYSGSSKVTTTNLSDNPYVDVGPLAFATFLAWNGYIPCVRGQQHYPRDANNDGTLDNPQALGYSDDPITGYPDYIGFYPQVRDIENFDASLLYSGGRFEGIYGSYDIEVEAKFNCIVRRATLMGIHAMIESEVKDNKGVVFNQVALVPFATMGYVCLDLSNDMDTALRVAASRLTTYPGIGRAASYITPHASGATNIGMGVKRSLQVLTDPDGRGRSFANKTIAMLTDGQPTYSISSDFASLDYDSANQTEYLEASESRGESYARWAAEQCGAAGVTLHTIGIGNAVSTSGRREMLEYMADQGDGTFSAFSEVTSDASQERLRELFVAIGKDKIGKLYLD